MDRPNHPGRSCRAEHQKELESKAAADHHGRLRGNNGPYSMRPNHDLPFDWMGHSNTLSARVLPTAAECGQTNTG